MRTLVTGAAGQVGQDLITALVARGDEVIATDVVARPAWAERLGVAWRPLDVRAQDQVDAVLHEAAAARVFHLAAILSARGEANPQLTYEVNQTGTYHVLEGCRRAGVRQVLFTSTIAVYGPPLPELVDDRAPQRPRTMYGLTKVAGELLGEYYHRRFGLDVRGVRYPGLISASLPGGGTSDYALFIYVDGVRRGEYAAFCREDTRIPLMYMPDGIRALVELAEAPRERLRQCIYNVAAFSPRADAIAASAGRALPAARFTFAPDPARQAILDSWPVALDDRAAREDWGWAPAFDLDAMTDDLVPRIRALLAADAGALDGDHAALAPA
jgi:threonine 3-dehydrogenase